MTNTTRSSAILLALVLSTAVGCAGRGAPTSGTAALPRGDGATLRYQCADGVRVDVQPTQRLVPELGFDDGPVDVRLGGASHAMRPVRVGSGMRYESARAGWEWFGKDDRMSLRDTKAGTLLARDCRLMRGAAAS